MRAVLLVMFIFLTALISAHMIARAAYVVGAPLREGTRVDDPRGRYDPDTHALSRPNSAAPRPRTTRPCGPMQPNAET